ncbi:malonic semialdehyde reductase, partial [Acinetobacter baumannii]
LDKPVSEAQLHAIWDLMKWGPTSANQLPARLVWCVSDEAKAKLAACASEGNRSKILQAPVTAIVAMDVEFHEHLPELFPHVDAKSWFDGNTELREASAFRNSSLQGAHELHRDARLWGPRVRPSALAAPRIREVQPHRVTSTPDVAGTCRDRMPATKRDAMDATSRTLVIDTATAACSVALIADGQVIAAEH